MEQKQYKENACKIVELVAGMTSTQWDRVASLINTFYVNEKAKVSFEVPERLTQLIDRELFLWL